jgi:2-dehydro-3-deoxygluconokinase
MSTIVCFGEILLRLAAPGLEPLLRSARLEAQFGGAEANTGISLAYFGHRARLVSTLPDNDLGRACLGELRRHGADVSDIALRPGRMGLYFYTAPAQLRPAQVLYDRAGSAFANADAAAYDWNAVLEGADWLHISGITPALGPRAADALQRAVDAARAAQVRISFDCNIRPSLWQGRESEAPALIRNFARDAQLLFGNSTDIAALFGGNYASLAPQEAQRRAADQAFEACPALDYVAATHRQVHSADHHGLCAFLSSRHGNAASNVHELNPIIERIGGGDAFAAGVLHGLCSGWDLKPCVDFAAAATALKHTLPGDFNTLGAADVAHLRDGGRLDVRR